MKKLLSIMLCLVLLAPALVSCNTGSDSSSSGVPSSAESAASSDTESEPGEDSTPEESSEEVSAPVIDRTWPYVTASFIQFWAFASYTESKWDVHLGYLKEAGIDTVILQGSVNDTDGVITEAYYPTKLNENKRFTQRAVERVLKACKKKGMKCYIGLNNPERWFSVTLTDKAWLEKEAKLGVAVAREMYDLYKEEYPDTFYGWYFVPEFYSGIGNSENGAEFLNIYLDGLTEIDPSMPLMLSPFLNSGVSAEETGREWTTVFAGARFRAGDIFCCQDSVGAGGIPLADLDAYFAELKKACDTEEGLIFWANNENFTLTGNPAPMERFGKQLEISDKYVTGHITFAYDHYYCPDVLGGDTSYHDAYVEYYNTGKYTVNSPISREEEYTGKKTLASLGCSYTGTVNTRHDSWDDNGTKLTDGKHPGANGNSLDFYGADSGSFSVVIDLGEIKSHLGEFVTYDCYGNWGIGAIESVTYYVSDDGKSWTKVGNTVEAYNLLPVENNNGWHIFDFKCVPAESVSGRYVKAEIVNEGNVWISEIGVYSYDEE